MKKYYTLWIYITLLIILLGCVRAPSNSPNELPDVDLPVKEMNTKLRITAPTGWNSFKIGESINLDVQVIGSDQVIFSNDYGARIFQRKEDQWLELENFMTYPEGSIILASSKENSFNSGMANVEPIISEEGEPVDLVIFLIGNIYQDGKTTDDRTVGYIKVSLTP